MKQPAKKQTPFARRVYDAVSKIPRGQVATYKSVADAVQCGSSRAVGQALKANPFAPRVPCHRVIRSDLTIGGYQGRTQGEATERKKRLLAEEGVRFIDVRLADPGRLFSYPANGE